MQVTPFYAFASNGKDYPRSFTLSILKADEQASTVESAVPFIAVSPLKIFTK